MIQPGLFHVTETVMRYYNWLDGLTFLLVCSLSVISSHYLSHIGFEVQLLCSGLVGVLLYRGLHQSPIGYHPRLPSYSSLLYSPLLGDYEVTNRTKLHKRLEQECRLYAYAYLVALENEGLEAELSQKRTLVAARYIDRVGAANWNSKPASIEKTTGLSPEETLRLFERACDLAEKHGAPYSRDPYFYEDDLALVLVDLSRDDRQNSAP